MNTQRMITHGYATVLHQTSEGPAALMERHVGDLLELPGDAPSITVDAGRVTGQMTVRPSAEAYWTLVREQTERERRYLAACLARASQSGEVRVLATCLYLAARDSRASETGAVVSATRTRVAGLAQLSREMVGRIAQDLHADGRVVWPRGTQYFVVPNVVRDNAGVGRVVSTRKVLYRLATNNEKGTE